MLFDGIKLVEGSEIQNMVVDVGPAFPANPDEGELFYRNDGVNEGLYVYNGSTWNRLADASSILAALGYTPVNRAGDTMTGPLTLFSDPATSTQAATKHYVDQAVAAIPVSNSTPTRIVKSILDQHVPLNGSFVVDGQVALTGDRILVINQVNPAENGIWLANASGAWTRAADWQTGSHVHQGELVWCNGGIKYGYALMVMLGPQDAIVGSDSYDFLPILTISTTISAGGTGASTRSGAINNLLPDQGASAGKFLKTDGANVTWSGVDFSDLSGRPTTVAGYGITDAQPLDADLTAIAALSGSTGLLKKTGANSWEIDSGTYLTDNQVITLSGDVTGAGTTSISTTLADTGVVANSYGGATHSAAITVDSKGRITAASDVSIELTASAITAGTFDPARISESAVTQHQGALQISESQIQDGTLLARVDGTESITGTWTFTHPVTGQTPTAGTHLATKSYVDSIVSGGQTLIGSTVIPFGEVALTLEGLTNVQSTTFTGDLVGAASSAGHLTTARAISATGDASWTVNFDGSAPASAGLTLASVNVTPPSDAFCRVTANNKGLVTATSAVGQSDIVGALGYTPVNTAGDTMTGALTLHADPSSDMHAATKHYVDTVASGMNVHSSVRAATLAALSASYDNGTGGVDAILFGTGSLPLIDGISLSATQRVLVKNQADARQNGVYVVSTVSPDWVLTRAVDFDNSPSGEVQAGDSVYVEEGSQATTQWVQITAGTINVGSTNIVFTQFGGPGSYAAGTGIDVSGTIMSNTGVTGLTGTTDQISVSAATGSVTLSLPSAVSIAGTMTAGGFSGSGAALTSIPNGALVNSSITVGSTAIALGAAATTLSGLSSVSSTSFSGELTGNASTATVLKTARTINGVSFNGSANIDIAVDAGDLTGTTLKSSVVSSSLTSVGTLNSLSVAGAVTASSFSGAGTGLTGTASSLSIGGNAATATYATSAGTAATASAAGSSSTVAITNDTTTAVEVYPTWVSAQSGDSAPTVTASRLSFIPSTGVLSATGFSGAGTGLTGTASSLSIGGNAATSTSTSAISGGATGSIVYQSAQNTTAFLTAGTSSQVLVSGTAPSWTNTPALSGAQFTSIPNTALINSSVTVGSTAIALGSAATTLTGLSSVTATTFTGALTGNASTASTLANSRAISATGDAAWTVNFDGSAGVSAAMTLATVNSGPVSAGFHKITTNGKGLVTASTAVTATDITNALGYVPYSSQNSNAVAITGGSIDGTTIGATTASTGRFSAVTDTALTSGRVVLAGTDGLLEDSANLTFSGSTLTVSGQILGGNFRPTGSIDTDGMYLYGTNSIGLSTNGIDALNISAVQNIGIGQAASSNRRLGISTTATDISAAEYASYSVLTANNVSGSPTKIGARGQVSAGASYAGTGVLNAVNGFVTSAVASGTVSGSMQAFRSQLSNTAGGTVSAMYGFAGTAPSNTGGGTITNFYGFSQDDVTTASNVYGWSGNIQSGTNKWNLYMIGSAQNYFLGNVGIGTGKSAPSVALDVAGAGAFTGALSAASIDSTPIGASSASTGRFTTLTATGQTTIGLSPVTTTNVGLTVASDSTAAPNSNILSQRSSSDAVNSALILRKTRGTCAAPTIVAASDVVGGVEFQAYDGSAFGTPASIQCFIDTSPAAGSLPGKLSFRTAANGATSTTERMYIDSTGKVTAAGTVQAGALEATPIGASTPSTGKFTSVTSTGAVSLNNILDFSSGSTSVITTSATTVNTFATATYRSAKYLAQIADGTSFEIVEFLVVHDGTTVYMTTYGNVYSGAASLGSFDASISAGTLSVTYTALAATGKTVKLMREAIAV